jgi:hypothetical protein
MTNDLATTKLRAISGFNDYIRQTATTAYAFWVPNEESFDLSAYIT